MAKITLDLMLKVAEIFLDILIVLKDKFNGRKKDDDKRDAEKE
jgi:hypothetical protein